MTMQYGAPWRIEREDQDDGKIKYHVWSVDPPEWLFAISEQDHDNAKGLAEKIVGAVNEAAILDNLAHDHRVSAEGLGLRVRQSAHHQGAQPIPLGGQHIRTPE